MSARKMPCFAHAGFWLAACLLHGCVMFPTTSTTRTFDERDDERIVPRENTRLLVEQVPGQRLRFRVSVEGDFEKHYRSRSVTERTTRIIHYNAALDIVELLAYPIALALSPIALVVDPFTDKPTIVALGEGFQFKRIPMYLIATLPLINAPYGTKKQSHSRETKIIGSGSWHEELEAASLSNNARVLVEANLASGQRVLLSSLPIADGPDFDLRSSATRAGGELQSLIFTLDACQPPLTHTLRLQEGDR